MQFSYILFNNQLCFYAVLLSHYVCESAWEELNAMLEIVMFVVEIWSYITFTKFSNISQGTFKIV